MPHLLFDFFVLVLVLFLRVMPGIGCICTTFISVGGLVVEGVHISLFDAPSH
jgi:hypothetical protein